MVFNSWTFLAFFAVVLLLHNLPFGWTAKKCHLLVASYIFYAAWNPPFVILLWLATVVDWWVARAIATASNQRRRKAYLLVSLMVNFGLLGFFKYGAFLVESFSSLLAAMGILFHPLVPDIVLPVGISFYTFVTLSYTIDVYRGTIKPCGSFLDYALLVTFFPHLVAGPILRAEKFLPQCMEPRKATSGQLGWGCTLMLVGLFEKIVLADGLLAPVADGVFNRANVGSWIDAWLGTLAFSGQIFFDFNGYSLCAIGAALCLGFAFPDNFRFPYAAIGFSDFWRRWHISLSSWLRDYLYISLGGNRKGDFRTRCNLFLTMLLGGLWHGAAWHFVIWGGLHGLYLSVERFVRDLWVTWFRKAPLQGGAGPAGEMPSGKEDGSPLPLERWQAPSIPQAGLMLLTFGLTCVAWVFFRSPTVGQALSVIGAMFSAQAGTTFGLFEILSVVGVTIGLLGTHWILRDKSLEWVFGKLPLALKVGMVAVMLVAIAMAPGDEHAFIYFQF